MEKERQSSSALCKCLLKACAVFTVCAAAVLILLNLDNPHIPHFFSRLERSASPSSSSSSSNFTITIEGATISPENLQIACNSAPTPTPTRLRVLVGILTRADLYERRHLLRMLYGIQPLRRSIRGNNTEVDIVLKYVICRLYKDDQTVLVALEIMAYGDILIIDCNENMDSGKTYAYFSTVAAAPGEAFDYVMKADDDTYLRMDALAETVAKLPREDLYFGCLVPCNTDELFKGHYMSGMAYGLSWDLVHWIADSDLARNMTVGPEDKLVGTWLDRAGRGRNRVNVRPAMYDFPAQGGACAHELVAGSVAVHRLKGRGRWFDVIKYFNVTEPVRRSSSKFYRLD